MTSGGGIRMTVAYSIIFALSLFLPVGYYLFVRKNKSEPWLLVLYLSVCTVNLGYLLLAASKTVEFALTANKIAYFGQVFIPLCMFMIISGLCGFTYKKWVKYTLVGVALLMFVMVLTTGHLDWYYKSVELTQADGASKLVKVYGPLHPVNLLYVLSYFAAMTVVIVISLNKSKGSSQKLAGLMLAVVIGNVGMWIVEKLITWNFEFLSVSYLMSAVVFLFVYWMLQDYIHLSDVPSPAVVLVDSATSAEKLEVALRGLPQGTVLTAKEKEVLQILLDGKSRKEISAILHVSENTVKTHLAHLYEKFNVSGREELLTLVYKK